MDLDGSSAVPTISHNQPQSAAISHNQLQVVSVAVRGHQRQSAAITNWPLSSPVSSSCYSCASGLRSAFTHRDVHDCGGVRTLQFAFRFHSQHTNTITMSLVSTPIQPPPHWPRYRPCVSDMCSLVPPVSSLEHSSFVTCALQFHHRAFLVPVLSRIEMCLRGLLGPSAAPVGAQVCQPSHHRGRRRRVQLGHRD